VTGSPPTRSPRHQRSSTPAAAMAPSTAKSRSWRPCTSEQTPILTEHHSGFSTKVGSFPLNAVGHPRRPTCSLIPRDDYARRSLPFATEQTVQAVSSPTPTVPERAAIGRGGIATEVPYLRVRARACRTLSVSMARYGGSAGSRSGRGWSGSGLHGGSFGYFLGSRHRSRAEWPVPPLSKPSVPGHVPVCDILEGTSSVHAVIRGAADGEGSAGSAPPRNRRCAAANTVERVSCACCSRSVERYRRGEGLTES
jgi:hypothetical protein